jgi:hypothetical protein
MDVRLDRVGRAALRNGGFGHRVVEAGAAVADVEDHYTPLGCERSRNEAAVLHDIVEGAAQIRRAGIGVSEDVAGRSVSRMSAISSRVSTPPICTITVPPKRALPAFIRWKAGSTRVKLRQTATGSWSMFMNSNLSLPELEDRIAILRDNIRQLVEQAAGAAGSENEERAADRIAQQSAELDRLVFERDALVAK